MSRGHCKVLVYSWWGRNGREDQLVRRTMDSADRYGIKVAFHIEPYGGRTAASVKNDIIYIYDTYGNHPAFAVLPHHPRARDHSLVSRQIRPSVVIAVAFVLMMNADEKRAAPMPGSARPGRRHVQQAVGLTLDPANETDAEAVLTIVRITGGNFRLIERLMTQALRVLEINGLDTITPDVVEAAHETLVIGT